MSKNAVPMKDVQNDPAEVPLNIDRVGVKNLRVPLAVRDRESGRQHTVANVSLGVDLPGGFKGTHMSRFVEALEDFNEHLDHASFKALLADIRDRLKARRAHARLTFPYFMTESSPSSGSASRMAYDCSMDGELEGDRLTYTLGVDVPVMTVCPCSLAISEDGAHSQRAMVRIQVRFKGFVWLEDLIAIARRSGSSPVYPLLKREDEKHVTEEAFANPRFVEDVVRGAAQGLSELEPLTWFRVEVESFESIHDHSAHASIEMHLDR